MSNAHPAPLSPPISGVPEIIKDCETGYLAEADDDECYAGRIYDAIENKEQMSRMVELEYLRIIGQHTMKTYRQKIWETYEERCAEGRQTPLR
jgi:glycosyltransferase involved in cell wall biosynthesis